MPLYWGADIDALRADHTRLLAAEREARECMADAHRQQIEAMRSTRDGIHRELAAMTTRCDQLQQEVEEAKRILRKLACQPLAPHDHMTACDRTMGDSHPCTCHANEARQWLSTNEKGAK
jgi:chromosome segregation ATPase